LTNLQKLESDTYRLKDIESLRNLFADLNYEFEDKPVDKQNWNQEVKSIVQESRIVAKKADYLIYYIKTNSDSIKDWKKVATRIISDNHGFCLVCSHNPSGFQWIFSTLAKEFSKSFAETRHIPIELKPNVGVHKPFLEFLQAIEVKDSDKGTNILKKISDAFDKFSFQIHDELTVNVFEALKSLAEGIIGDKSNNLVLSKETLDEIREPIFILLYRIIFVLYAEDRAIFPIDNKIYYDTFSLKWIKHFWILISNNQIKLDEYDVQTRLKSLFRLIEVGSEELNFNSKEFFMRSYYGRLFDKKLNFQLEKWNIPNKFYLQAIEFLTSTKDNKGNKFFLDYSALEIRHLGSIYEHLLEFHLTIKNKKIADLPNPKDRKTTGSYYTPDFLVDYLVKNSIQPIINKITNETSDKSKQIEEILSLKILDPAMGSGHFLVGVIDYLAQIISKIENKDDSEQNYIERKRDVVRQCIYGVDINPLAVDLAQLSLWLDTLSSDKPLTFLSAHLKNGNSLMGESVEKVFDPQQTLMESTKKSHFKKTVKDFLGFEALEDNTASAVKAKIEKYEKMRSKGSFYHQLRGILDCCIAPYFGIKVEPLGDLRQKIGIESLDFYSESKSGESVFEIRNKHHFFHWELEFPEIFFTENGDRKDDGGFDVIIGNPPWERLKVQDREFFASRDPAIANATNASLRKKMIQDIKKTNQILFNEYQEKRITTEQQTDYLKKSGKFPLGAVGDLNLYPIFLELSRNLLKKNGHCGMVVQTGIISDMTYQKFFEDLIFTSSLVACYDFSNKQKIFEDVIANERFSLIFLKTSSTNNSNFSISILNETIEDLFNEEKKYWLNKNEIILFNPNTHTCPLFHSKKDYELCKKIYLNNSVLVKDNSGILINPWKIEYWRMYDMALDSGLFNQKEDLLRKGFILNKTKTMVKDEKKFIPLYEAKFFNNYDHRYGSFENIPKESRFGVKAEPYDPTDNQKKDSTYEIEPRYWIEENNVKARCKQKEVLDEYFFAFRNVCRTFTDSRTARGTIIPFSAVGHSASLLLIREKNNIIRNKKMILFSCIFSSMTFDYIVRQKLSGANLSKYILEQIAIPSPESFEKLKLTYNKKTNSAEAWCIELSSSVIPVTKSLGKIYKNFDIKNTICWNEQDRFDKICFIDAIIAHVYGLNKKDYEYILNQFPILQRQEIEKFGKFVSFEKCLKYFELFEVVSF